MSPNHYPITVYSIALLLGACATQSNREANSPEASGPVCRVTIESWKGTAESVVRGETSDVQGGFGSSTAVISNGSSVIIKGWLGDVTIGRLEPHQFVVVAWGKEFPSEPYVDGQTAFTASGMFGEYTQPIFSENCTNEQLGLGGAHLIALALQSPSTRRRN